MNYTNLLIILCIFLLTLVIYVGQGPSIAGMTEGFSGDITNALNAPVNYLNNASVSSRNVDIGGTGGSASGATGEMISVDPIPAIPVNEAALREDECTRVTGLAGLRANPKCGFCHTDGKGHTKNADGTPSFVNCPTWSPTVDDYLKYIRRQQCARIKLPQDISYDSAARKGCGFCLMSGNGAYMENGAPKYAEDADCAPLQGTRGKETAPSFVTDINSVPSRIQDMLNMAGEAANVARAKGYTNDPCPAFETIGGKSVLTEFCANRYMNTTLNENVAIGPNGGAGTPDALYNIVRNGARNVPQSQLDLFAPEGPKGLLHRAYESADTVKNYFRDIVSKLSNPATPVDTRATLKYFFNKDYDVCDDYAPGTKTGLACIKKLFEEEGCHIANNQQAPTEQNQAEFDAPGSVEQIRRYINQRKMKILAVNEKDFVDGRKFCYGVEQRPISTTALSNKIQYALWNIAGSYNWSANRPMGFNPVRKYQRQDTMRTLQFNLADAQVHQSNNRQATNMFLVLIRGMIKAPETGNYVFRAGSDDHILMTLNHLGENQEPETIIEAPFYQGKTFYESKPIFLRKDHYYPFNIWHGQGYGGQNMHIQWKQPGKSSFVNIDPTLLQENNLAPYNVREITITKYHWGAVNLNELEVYDENDENVMRSGKQGKVTVEATGLGWCNRYGYSTGCDPARLINGKIDKNYWANLKDGSTNYIHSRWPNERFVVRIQFEKPIAKVRYVKLYARGDCCKDRSVGLCINFRSELAPEQNRPENRAAHEAEYRAAPSWRGWNGFTTRGYWSESHKFGSRFTYPPAAIKRITDTKSAQHASVQAPRTRASYNRDPRGIWMPDMLWQTCLITDDERFLHEFAFPEQSLKELNDSVTS